MTSSMPILKPRGLEKGDGIAFVSPAGVPDPERIQRAADHLNNLGYRVIQNRDLGQRRGYLAGDDMQRADELMQAFVDEDVRAIFATRGGYGSVRLLDRLDWDVIRSHPKIVVGFSDITVLHHALWQKCGLITFHGPHPNDGFGHPRGLPAMADEAFWTGLRADRQSDDGYEMRVPPQGGPTVDDKGEVATGRLLGGNLALACSLMGTPFQVNYQNAILFLEDVGEPPYRVDRMFAQLQIAGILRKIAGVLFGQFTDCDAPDERSLGIDQVVQDYFGDIQKPMIRDFPAGHVQDNCLLPLGAKVEMNTHLPTLRVAERTVTT